MTKHVTRKDTVFKLLDQDGPFATRESVQHSPLGRDWIRCLKKNNLLNRYLITRNQICELLSVKSLSEVKSLIEDQNRRLAISQRAYVLLSRMFGITGSENECRNAVKNYAKTADGVIRYLKRTVLSPYSSYLEIDNKVDTVDDPVDLLMIPFDNRYHKKARFEAKRKLVLMQIAAVIEQRERETEVEKKFSCFLDFLNNHVWSAEAKIGEQEPFFLLSRHSPEDFSCCEVSVHSWDITDKACASFTGYGRKKTLIKRLRFHIENRKVPICVIVRKKESVAKVLKLLRKGEENPDVAVSDELGLMGVLDNSADVRLFQKHLIESAFRAGSFLTLEDVSDTLEGVHIYNGNLGSSPKTSMLKFFARMEGMRVEFIIHTNKSFLNYTYQRGVAHSEYEVNRLFGTGVVELLFPREIYSLDFSLIKDELLRSYRSLIETEV